jgi:hypothetical protein
VQDLQKARDDIGVVVDTADAGGTLREEVEREVESIHTHTTAGGTVGGGAVGGHDNPDDSEVESSRAHTEAATHSPRDGDLGE